VDYRLAPEHPYPAALDDCLGVTKRLLEDGAGLGLDPARIAVTGDSAGGNMAAVAAQTLPGIAHQALVFAVLDLAGTGSPRCPAGSGTSPSPQRWTSTGTLSRKPPSGPVRPSTMPPGTPRKSPLRLAAGEASFPARREGRLSPGQLRAMMISEFEQWLRSRTDDSPNRAILSRQICRARLYASFIARDALRTANVR
jgi:acetyl esterase/lipase